MEGILQHTTTTICIGSKITLWFWVSVHWGEQSTVINQLVCQQWNYDSTVEIK